jgi:hypothetical protein
MPNLAKVFFFYTFVLGFFFARFIHRQYENKIHLFLRFTRKETRRQHILIDLLVIVGVSLSNVCVRNGTSNAIWWRRKKNEENRHNLNDSCIVIPASGNILTLSCLLACVWRLSVREKKNEIYIFISIIVFERKKFFELCQTQ